MYHDHITHHRRLNRPKEQPKQTKQAVIALLAIAVIFYLVVWKKEMFTITY